MRALLPPPGETIRSAITCPLSPGGESSHHKRGSTDRVHPSLHIKLHLELREHQGQVHAKPIGAAGLCVLTVPDKE